MHSDYAQRLNEGDLRRFDWTKTQQLRGLALALWMVVIPLTPEHCQALRAHNSTDARRRRMRN